MSNESSTPSPDPAAPAAAASTTGTGTTGAAAGTTAAAPPPAAPPPRRTSRIKRFFLWWIAGVVAALAIWTLVALNWSYSAGDRGGLLQKFERKGWLCKTYEGQLALYAAPGLPPEMWSFTVRDKAVADQIAGLVGERVQLHYVEHRGLPSSCFGETGFFVDRVAPAPSPTPPVLPDATAPAAASPDLSAPPLTPSPP
jgi:hypothetical protein